MMRVAVSLAVVLLTLTAVLPSLASHNPKSVPDNYSSVDNVGTRPFPAILCTVKANGQPQTSKVRRISGVYPAFVQISARPLPVAKEKRFVFTVNRESRSWKD